MFDKATDKHCACDTVRKVRILMNMKILSEIQSVTIHSTKFCIELILLQQIERAYKFIS